MANQVGKRYICKKCGSEFIVTRGGKGAICCCGEPMEEKKKKESSKEDHLFPNKLGT